MMPYDGFQRKQDLAFSITAEALSSMMARADLNQFHRFGSVPGLLRSLHTSATEGISPQSAPLRRLRYGSNEMTVPRSTIATLGAIFASTLKDPILTMLLAVAGLVLAAPNSSQDRVEGYGVLVGLLTMMVVRTVLQAVKVWRLAAVDAQCGSYEVCVVRDGRERMLPTAELVVGDLVRLQAGEVIPAHGVVVSHHPILCDESALPTVIQPKKTKSVTKDPFLFYGTPVVDGYGSMLVVAVGPHCSTWPTPADSASRRAGFTHLQDRLKDVAEVVGRIGLLVAVVVTALLLCQTRPAGRGFRNALSWVTDILLHVLALLTVLVPKGFHLVVTAAAASIARAMLLHRCLLTSLSALEACGEVTAVVCCKSQVLDTPLATVARGWMAGVPFMVPHPAPSATSSGGLVTGLQPPPPLTLPFSAALTNALCESLFANTVLRIRPQLVEDEIPGVDQIELALHRFAQRLGHQAEEFLPPDGDVRTYLFSPTDQRMCTLVRQPDQVVQHVKGWADALLPSCTAVMQNDGTPHPLTDSMRNEALAFICQASAEGYTVLLVACETMHTGPAHQPFPSRLPIDDDLTCLALLALQCPCKADASYAVTRLQDAGAVVRMTSGDRLTATCKVAKKVGIYTPSTNGMALEGPKFRDLCRKDKVTLSGALPQLQVLARCAPEDRYILVAQLLEARGVVAVAVDAMHDAGALRLASVGVALRRGCPAVRRAAGVVALDNSLGAVATALLWGRCLHSTVRRFLRFQLTSILMTAAYTVVSVLFVSSSRWPLTAPQMLWLSLLLDGVVTFAFAMDLSNVDCFSNPVPRGAPLVPRPALKRIVTEVVFQTLMLILIACPAGAAWLELPHGSPTHQALVSNIFMLMQLLQLFLCRRGDQEGDSLRYGAKASATLFAIVSSYFCVQVLCTEFGAAFMGTAPLSFQQWLFAMAYAGCCLPLDWGVAAFSSERRAFQPVRRSTSVGGGHPPPSGRTAFTRWLLATEGFRLVVPRPDWALTRTCTMTY